MGGTIRVDSLYGIGSQFCVSISTGPIDKQQLIVGEPELPEKIDYIKYQYDYSYQVKGRILVVEDNPDNQQLLSILFHDIGAEVTYAENGQQAIDKATNKTFDLILMDMQMPVMGGIEATKKLREAGYTKPIVALTANAMKSDYEMCIEAGCDDFLTKPINKEKLFQVIYKCLAIENKKISNEKIVSDIFSKRSIKMQKLILKFIRGLPERIHKIEHYRNEKKWHEVKDELHKIKGVGTSMGYPIITEIAGGLEYEAIRENEIEVDKLLLEMKNICSRIEKSLPELVS